MPARDFDNPIPAGNARPVHLGDGTYASHDSFQVWVSADREGSFNAVALDAFAIEALVSYAKQIGLLK